MINFRLLKKGRSNKKVVQIFRNFLCWPIVQYFLISNSIHKKFYWTILHNICFNIRRCFFNTLFEKRVFFQAVLSVSRWKKIQSNSKGFQYSIPKFEDCKLEETLKRRNLILNLTLSLFTLKNCFQYRFEELSIGNYCSFPPKIGNSRIV